ncbi:STAS domain-containing protein [Aneurinibacillus terranovensis]|uniref:STAS domain-containing protein n=1 Tax=Aneurinibacillus terranovensis TaxID=278991 RepID=UPI0003FBEA13|nr:STAS domain-containing protein [Aneurinibacillus terranovensis]
MSPIVEVVNHLVENKDRLSREIVEHSLQQIDIKYPQHEIDRAFVDFSNFIKLFAQSLTDNKKEINGELRVWSRKLGERDASEGKKVADSLEVYPTIRQSFIHFISKIGLDHKLSMEEVLYITKRLNYNFDLCLNETVKAFDYFKEKIIRATQEEVSELSAPIVPIHNGVAVLPLIGVIDTYRAKYILERVVPRVAELKIECLIIDFSGIQTIDTMVTNHIFKIHDVLRLSGIQAILTGIRPILAQTAIRIGIDFSHIKTYATVHQALKSINIEK